MATAPILRTEWSPHRSGRCQMGDMRSQWVREIALPQMAKALSVSAGRGGAGGDGLRRWLWSGAPVVVRAARRARLDHLLAAALGLFALANAATGAALSLLVLLAARVAAGTRAGMFVAGVAGWRVDPDTGPQHQRSVRGRRQYRTRRTGTSSTPHNGAQTTLICARTRRPGPHVDTDQNGGYRSPSGGQENYISSRADSGASHLPNTCASSCPAVSALRAQNGLFCSVG
jgi:hypothetical protein